MSKKVKGKEKDPLDKSKLRFFIDDTLKPFNDHVIKPLYRKSHRTFNINDNEVVAPYPVSSVIFIVLIILVILSSIFIRLDLIIFFRNLGDFFGFLGKIFNPDFTYLRRVWGPLFETLQIAVVGTLIGGILAIPFAILSSLNIVKTNWIVQPIRAVMSVVRTIPLLVYAMIFLYMFKPGMFPGTVAMAVFTFGIVAKMLYERIETIDMSSYEAIESTGATKFQCFMTAVMPQILASYFSIVLYTFEINVRASAILGYIGAGGIGNLLNDRMSWREYEDVGAVLLIFFVVIFIIENTSRIVRKRLR